MASQTEACRAHALRCAEVAQRAHTREDRREFLKFAESWERLANEIEHNELLIQLIDELAAESQLELPEPTKDRRATRPFRHVAVAIVSISEHFAGLKLMKLRGAGHFLAAGRSYARGIGCPNNGKIGQ
jgi:hypothetical protein